VNGLDRLSDPRKASNRINSLADASHNETGNEPDEKDRLGLWYSLDFLHSRDVATSVATMRLWNGCSADVDVLFARRRPAMFVRSNANGVMR
jgi:hypothetical protein